jgi:predicted transcriptional regulator with HTH domain
MSGAKKKAVYPFLIFKEAWGICRKNLAKLIVIYLIFYLPYLFLSGLATVLPGDQSNILGIVSALLSLWSGVALLVAAEKVTGAESFGIGETIVVGAKKYLLNYLGVAILTMVFIVGALFAIASIAGIVSALAVRLSAILAIAIQIISGIAAICLLVYFTIRWALGGTACIVEKLRPISALKRSMALIKDYINPVVGEGLLFIITIVLASAPYMVWLAVFGSQSDGMEAEIFVGAVNNIIVNIMLMPFWAVMMVVLYKKLKEANESNVCA